MHVRACEIETYDTLGSQSSYPPPKVEKFQFRMHCKCGFTSLYATPKVALTSI